MNAPTRPLPLLVAELRAATAAEQLAAPHRPAIESQIIALIPAPADGEGTVKQDDLTVTFKTNRTVDTCALQASWDSLSANSQKAFTWKAALDLKQYRAIQDLDLTAFGHLAAFVTTKPAKPAITLKD